MRKDASLAVEEIMALKGWSFEEIDNIVKYNDKKRYEMWQTNDGVYRVRALGGWSVAIGEWIDPPMVQITNLRQLRHGYCCHGTSEKKWRDIQRSGALHRCHCSHIQFGNNPRAVKWDACGAVLVAMDGYVIEWPCIGRSIVPPLPMTGTRRFDSE